MKNLWPKNAKRNPVTIKTMATIVPLTVILKIAIGEMESIDEMIGIGNK